jgi:HD-GYP domain-containing protein (c-di-GMP phosphodiesterase class II)
MVAPIVLAMEMRDPYTAGHQSRVADIAVAIGKEMGWPEGQLQGLRVAAQVHDIGKISIPAEILTKPTSSTRQSGR